MSSFGIDKGVPNADSVAVELWRRRAESRDVEYDLANLRIILVDVAASLTIYDC